MLIDTNNYMSVKDKAIEWNVCQSTVSAWCQRGRIPGLVTFKDKSGRVFATLIPKDAVRPKPLTGTRELWDEIGMCRRKTV